MDIFLVTRVVNGCICGFLDIWSLLRPAFYQVCVPLFFIQSTAVSATVQSMDTCNACFRFRARIIVIYNSRTKGPMMKPSGTSQFESTSCRFANLLKFNAIIFNICFLSICKYSTKCSR